MTGEWLPKNKRQEEIQEFWSKRGFTEIQGVLGVHMITFHNPKTNMVLDLQYLEQFLEEFNEGL